MAEEEPMKEKQLVASMAEHSAAVPSAMSAWERVGRNTAMGVFAGVAAGTLLATYRGHSVPFYAASMGANYGMGSLAFFGSEALIRKARGGKRDALGYAGAGWVAGMALTLPIGGRYQALVAGATMAAVGYGGFYAHRQARAYLDGVGREVLKERAAEEEGQRQGRGGGRRADSASFGPRR